MSVSHPLLKQLKGNIYNFRTESEVDVKDHHLTLLPLCQTIEEIFQKGLKTISSTPFGLLKKDYWFWIHYLYEQRDTNRLPFALTGAIEAVKSSKKVQTNLGRGRLFIRTALSKKLLQTLLKCFLDDEVFAFTMYDPHSSILGNEILLEILSSLFHELNKIDFKLELKNASFLDETWTLGVFKKYEFVPCKEMGITFAYVKGRVVVVKVEEGSVAAEDNQIEPGDALDELYGESLYRCNRRLIPSLANKYRGLPVYLSVVKGTGPDGKVYPPLRSILEKLRLREVFEERRSEKQDSTEDSNFETRSDCLTFSLLLLGRFQVKNGGRAEHIELAIHKALELKLEQKDVVMEMTERELRVVDKKENNVMINKHFSEISACGRKKVCPDIFAFIFGNTTCTIADEFQCFVMQAPSESTVTTILSAVAHGFVKTHWEV